MAWNLKGSYAETCSCELMCPCNLSFDHGATYDFCRATLAFDIREGEVDGTDVGGLNGRGDHRHPEGHDRRQLAARHVPRRAARATSRPTSSPRSSAGSSAARWPRSRRWWARCSASSGRAIEIDRRRPAPQRPRRRRDRLRDRGHRAVRRRDRRARPVRRHVPPGRLGSHDGRGEALADQRVRHRVRGQDRALDVRVLLGRADRRSAPDRPPAATAGADARRARAARPRRAAVRARRRRLVVDGRPDAGHGRRAVDRARDARLVPRRLGRDDGRDDVPVGRADGRAVRAHDDRIAAGRRCCSPPATSWRGRPPAWSRSRSRAAGSAIAGDVLAWDRAGRWVAGATLLVAAVYELTPLKDVCLRKCRSPLGFLLGAWRDGRAGALRMGVGHGAWCVGCCWALMASLFALGVMSLVWMAFVAGAHRGREDAAVAPRRDLRDGGDPARARRAAARRARCLPALTIPGDEPMPAMQQMMSP